MCEPSTAIRKRVEAAHERQLARFKGTPHTFNGDTPALVEPRAVPG